MAKAQWAMANRRRARYGYPVSLMTRCFFCGCCTWALSLAFLVPVYSMEAAHHLATPPSEPPPQSAMFTFQLIKTVLDERDFGYDGDRSACFR